MPVYDTTFKELAKTGLAELLRFLLPGLTFAELVELPQELPSTLRATDLLVRVSGFAEGKHSYRREDSVRSFPQQT